ncbi:MAG TPA: hypothetical protein VKN36_14610, partial [Eudoraea sp.]|nr:hypothetical protein [Eudoraea sp.]
SASNRTYTGRLMATYNSGVQKNKMVCAFSVSRRWADQGYIEGTLYDAYSIFGGVEYQYSKKSSLYFTAILASNRRGRSAAITREVFQMAGHRYNPYWGYQNGVLRNSRVRKIKQPILMLNHLYQADKLFINTGIAYRFGQHSNSRLGYYNAPNPDPTYYRYLPSFYLNSPIGANFLSAQKAREGFLRHPQLNWERAYQANTTYGSKQKAAYVLYDDEVEDTSFTLNGVANLKASDHCDIELGLRYTALVSRNNARIRDLLGAEFHEDIDPFSNTLNDVNAPREKQEGDIINYDYRVSAGVMEAFTQIKCTGSSWDAFIAGTFSKSTYNREGLFLNERFPDHSLGKSENIEFSNIGIKGGVTCQISGRHWVKAHAAILTRAPFLQNAFINPREHDETVPGIQNERLSSADLNYFIRLPDLTGRLTGFYSRFQNGTDVNFFFVDAGLGSDFVQEAITGLDKLNMGIELGMSYKVSPMVKLTAVSAIYKQLYASDPFVRINFDTAGDAEDLISAEGFKELGVARIKDHRLAQGPQKAWSLGVEYRDPTYWWVGVTANYLGNNYPNIATITRTRSFYLDPREGQPFRDATEENVNRLLKQRSLDTVYLLNLVGGKSWLLDGKYISVFASISNVFDRIFRTGGYEQSRNGNYGQLARDNLSGMPSFAPKYWYGYGRTYFLNIAVSF